MQIRSGKKFCGARGPSLDSLPTSHSSSPQQYTPKHRTEKIFTAKAALESKRRQGTVLFAGLKVGLMELPADRDHKPARSALALVLERIMDAVAGLGQHARGAVTPFPILRGFRNMARASVSRRCLYALPPVMAWCSLRIEIRECRREIGGLDALFRMPA